MNSFEKYDLLFLLRALRIEAHGYKKTNPGYSKVLLDKLDQIQPLVIKEL